MRMARPVADIEDLCGLQEHLLAWYDSTHRLLPWRSNKHSRRSPPEPAVLGSAWTAATADRSAPSGLSAPDFAYGVLVSEVMLQQTQVARAQDYFTKWVHRWPTAASLAAATPDEVNAAWAGLGYYRRARYLLDGAKYVAAQPGSVLPTTCAQLRKVPGVGPYTAAAVASIAYGERVAAVDGNVVRVVSRLLALRQEAPASSAAAKEMQALADGLLHPGRPGCWNQAMMELGARVCTPRSPVCGECPVSRWCAALALERSDAAAAGNEGRRITDFPARPVKAAKKEESLAVCVLEWRAAPDSRWLLLARREDKGLLAGQWEFPCAPEDTTPQCDVDSVLRRLGHGDACAVQHQQLGVVEHVFSHVKWTMQVQHRVLHRNGAPAVLQGVTDAGTPWRWLKLDADGACAEELTGGLRKVLALLKPAKRKAR